jgi:hypothetical protein
MKYATAPIITCGVGGRLSNYRYNEACQDHGTIGIVSYRYGQYLEPKDNHTIQCIAVKEFATADR